MKNFNMKKLAIIGFFFISIVGTLSHFMYEWSGNNSIVGAFFAVNESVWEHLKIAIIPAFIWMLVEYFIKEKKHNFFIAKLISFLLIMIFITFIFYSYTAILGKSVLLFDILLFYIAIGLGQYVSYKIMNIQKHLEKSDNFSKIFIILILVYFVLFTYFPPKMDIFKDPISKGYGIVNSNSTEKLVNLNCYKYL